MLKCAQINVWLPIIYKGANVNLTVIDETITGLFMIRCHRKQACFVYVN